MSDSLVFYVIIFSGVVLVSGMTWYQKVLRHLPEGQEKKQKIFWYKVAMNVNAVIGLFGSYLFFSRLLGSV